MRIYRYIGVTVLTLQSASRINALKTDIDAPASAYVAASADNFTVDCGNNRNDIFLIIKNTSGSNDITVIQTAYATIAGIVLSNETTVIGEGDEAIIGPINHNQMLSSDVAEFTLSGTSVTGFIMAMKVVANDA